MVQTLFIGNHRVWAKTAPASAIDKIPSRQPEALEAIRGGARFADQVYGRPIPYVIGTGPVDGMPVYGGAATVVTTTTTTTQAAEQQPAAWNPPGSYSPRKWLTKNAKPAAATTTQTSTKDFVSTGNLLARNMAGEPYELVQIVVDGTIMLDRQQSVPATVNFNFRDGLDTVPNPLVQSQSGRDLLHASDIQLFINGYEDSRAPSVKAVISETPSSPVAFTDIEWTGTAPSVTIDANESGYDAVDGFLYQVFADGEIPGVTGAWLIALDVANHREIYRVRLENAGAFTTFAVFPLLGTSYVVVRGAGAGVLNRHSLYNATTGEELTHWEEPDSLAFAGETVIWRAQMPFRSKFLMLGSNINSLNGHYQETYFAVVDPVAPTITVTRHTDVTLGNIASPGRRSLAFSSFFATDGLKDLYEAIWDGENLDFRFLHTFSITCTGGVYDAETDLLIATLGEGSTFQIQSIDPDNGAVGFTVNTATPLSDGTGARYWPLPGFAFLPTLSIDNGDVYLFDISARTLTLWGEDSDPFSSGYPLFVQSLGAFYMGQGLAKWREVKVARFTPGTVPLETALRRIFTLSGWAEADLTFAGFDCSSLAGMVLDRDTNTQGPASLLSQIFDFAYADIGSGMYFQKTAHYSLCPNATIPEADLIRVDGQSIISLDDPDNRMPATLNLDYISVGSGYQRRQVTSVRPAGLYDVTGSLRADTISAPVVLQDDDANDLVHLRHFSLLDFARIHLFELPPRYARLVPGNVVQIVLSEETLTVEITKVVLRPNHSLGFEGRDFHVGDFAVVAALEITGTPVLTATQDAAYGGFTVTASGGTGPYVFSLVGAWPAGISIDSGTGEVTGTPTESGSFTGLSVRVTDANSDTADLATFTLGVGEAGGGTMPEGAVAHLDFVTGYYYAGGGERAVGDILGGAFNAGDIGEDGMSTLFTNSNRPDAIGALFTDLEALWGTGFTVIVEIDVASTSGINGTYFITTDGASYGAADWAAYAYSQAYLATEDWNGLYVEGAEFPTLGEAGVHRFGFTFYRDIGGGDYESANSIDGEAAATATTTHNGPDLLTPTRFGILHDGDLVAWNGNWVARSITFYPAKTPAELEALSSLA